MKKIVLGALLFCMSSTAYSNEVAVAAGCFSAFAKHKINLKFVTITIPLDKAKIGYVKYQRSEAPILLSLIKEESIILSEDRPYEYTSTWREVVDGEFNGEYIITSQGSRYGSFIYKGKNGKTLEFTENIDSSTSDRSGCNWQ
jgi:hypothetical protein